MNSNNPIHSTHTAQSNLLGEGYHRHFLSLQASFGFAQRGGVSFPFSSEVHSKRLVSTVNILTAHENKQLIFSESIFSN